MFERFTDRARKVVVLAQEEARMLDHNCVGPEHILLGVIHEGQGLGARALTELGVSLSEVRQQVEEIIGRGEQAPSGHIPFTPRTKKVLELSLREALQLGHNYIGTEHITLAILREGENVAAQVLVRMGVNQSKVRLQVIKLLAPEPGGEAAAAEEGTASPEGGRRPREIRMARSAVRYDFLLAEMRDSLAAMAERLTAIERHLGITASAAGTGSAGEPPGDGGSADDKGSPADEPEDPPEDPPEDVTASGE
jgi:ATP-dependent Clp protease ATP-binding subunit ClpA